MEEQEVIVDNIIVGILEKRIETKLLKGTSE